MFTTVFPAKYIVASVDGTFQNKYVVFGSLQEFLSRNGASASGVTLQLILNIDSGTATVPSLG
jgi:hypothetical protein